MQTVTTIFSLAAGGSITLAGLCAAAWLVERRDPATLMLCVLGIGTGGAAYIELGMMHSATPAEYGEWMRWYHVPVYLSVMALVLFVRYFLKTGRPWVMWTIVAMRSIVLAVDFLVDPDFNYRSIASLRHVTLFGERLSVIGDVVSRTGWQLFATLSLILLLAYLVDAALQRLSAGGDGARHQTMVIFIGMIIPMLGAVGYSQWVAYGIIHAPASNLPWFLGTQLIMANELVRDAILTRSSLREMNALLGQLTRMERLNFMGQLASSVAHELTQPLSANVLNAKVALKEMEGQGTGFEDLRAILGDMERDSQRAADLLTRIRSFSKTHTVELKPLAVEEVVKDVVSLIGVDVMAKHVSLALDIPPGLPNVLADRVHLSQVLLNLLMNAIQAVQSSPRHAKRITVEARAMRGKSRIEIAVRDSGPGVPDAVAEKLFLPFFTTKPDGMGVGLALSRGIIEAHGGHLWVDRTAKHGGAVFRFTLRQA